MNAHELGVAISRDDDAMQSTETMMSARASDALVFGKSAHPVTCGLGVTIGAGQVFPEVNYTLPATRISRDALDDIRAQYREMVGSILGRAAGLGVPALVLEFEQPYEFTLNPDWGALITADTKRLMLEAQRASGLKSALRVTIADIRDRTRPPRMRSGEEYQRMEAAFSECADAGADILSIESTGGKEITDEALTEGDFTGLLFGMSVLGGRDMEFLWDRIVSICRAKGVVAGGDSACGFGNTAMRLADMAYISKAFAALVRVASAARAVVAFERGAVGPSKDCAYEGVYVKAALGVPIALEGKSAACAHFSHIGNIASAYCDLWSNESVQNVRLLSGFAPEVFTEILTYDCRLMNEALKRGEERRLRDWLVATDAALDPQAYVLAPEVVDAVAEVLTTQSGTYARSVQATSVAGAMIAAAADKGELQLSTRERRWLDRLRALLSELPPSEADFIQQNMPTYRGRFLPEEYGL